MKQLFVRIEALFYQLDIVREWKFYFAWCFLRLLIAFFLDHEEKWTKYIRPFVVVDMFENATLFLMRSLFSPRFVIAASLQVTQY